ncbi:ABC transporter permease [Caproiciproducens sp. CPB-2]|uniref:ABC transporter permease n=1 Tax=unclassified Caproiciproducens TaxID=2643836 RepID=UPI0023DBB8CC|nr:ribose ABC transporter permease [Caproiciproducens sp. CPB-2]MDF1495536.1 ribose ABC transporter permease [Caproiciproducens sp. CPB-2]
MNAKEKTFRVLTVHRTSIILVLILIVAAFLSPAFLSASNMLNVIRQVSITAIIGAGMTFVILTGGIDLSVGSVVGLAGAFSAGVLQTTDSVPLAVGIGLLTGLICGFINGFFIAKCGIPAFIATLAMMTLLRGCILVYTNGTPISVQSDIYKAVGKGSLAGIPVPIIILLFVYLAAYILLTHTAYGRTVYAIGGNREAARLSGISVVKNEWIVYIIIALLSSLAGIILTARLGTAAATAGEGYEMDAIASVIIGGTSLAGGQGFILPTVIGALILGVLDNILTLMNVNPFATNIVKGVVILIAVLADKKFKDLSAKVNQ